MSLQKYSPIAISLVLGAIMDVFIYYKVRDNTCTDKENDCDNKAFYITYPLVFILLGVSWYFAREAGGVEVDKFYIAILSLFTLAVIVLFQTRSSTPDKKFNASIIVIVLCIIVGFVSLMKGNVASRITMILFIIVCFVIIFSLQFSEFMTDAIIAIFTTKKKKT